MICLTFVGKMNNEKKETIKVRVISVGFTVLALAVFKPFALRAWQWEAYAHLFALWILGIAVCFITECVLKYLVKMPHSLEHGAEYIIRRNLWFQLINTPLVSLMICLYRHFVLSDKVDGNLLSWGNFFETLVIMAFCSFLIGLYWRFKFRGKYLAAELEELKQMNEQLQLMQQKSPSKSMLDNEPEKEAQPQATHPDTIDLAGTTSETVTLHIPNLLYIESVGNYVKVVQLHEGKVATHMLRATSKQIEESLSCYPTIVRCHRAFLVNLQQVEKIISKAGAMQLLVKHSNDYLPVSRSNMAGIKQAIANKNNQ